MYTSNGILFSTWELFMSFQKLFFHNFSYMFFDTLITCTIIFQHFINFQTTHVLIWNSLIKCWFHIIAILETQCSRSFPQKLHKQNFSNQKSWKFFDEKIRNHPELLKTPTKIFLYVRLVFVSKQKPNQYFISTSFLQNPTPLLTRRETQ